jgi:transcriptional regulator with XRE-family HTH domain
MRVAGEAERATTGVAGLDHALGGLFWGDNVVWEEDDDGLAAPFVAAARAQADAYDRAVEVDPSGAASPETLLRQVRADTARSARELLVFDLDALSSQFGRDPAVTFFTRCCPMLLGHGAIAYWTVDARTIAGRARTAIVGITQIVLTVAEDRIRIAKAEGRPPSTQGEVLRYTLRDGVPQVEPAPAASRVAAALRALRLQKGIGQAEVARLADVSPSAISQAERGRRSLSLDTLLLLSAGLGISLDALLAGEIAPDYRIARLPDPLGRQVGSPLPLLDDAGAGLRAFLVRLGPADEAVLPPGHKGAELVAVASGLVQVVLATGQPVLRAGEALLATATGVTRLRNLDEGESVAFWVLRDDVGAG